MDENWLKSEMFRRGETPDARLLSAFDALHDRFQQGRSLSLSLIKTSHGLRPVEAGGLTGREVIEQLAKEAGLVDERRFAEIWHMLINGAVVAAQAGDAEAARKAKSAAADVLAAWQRNIPK